MGDIKQHYLILFVCSLFFGQNPFQKRREQTCWAWAIQSPPDRLETFRQIDLPRIATGSGKVQHVNSGGVDLQGRRDNDGSMLTEWLSKRGYPQSQRFPATDIGHGSRIERPHLVEPIQMGKRLYLKGTRLWEAAVFFYFSGGLDDLKAAEPTFPRFWEGAMKNRRSTESALPIQPLWGNHRAV